MKDKTTKIVIRKHGGSVIRRVSRRDNRTCRHRWHLMRWPNPSNNDITDFLCDKCGKMKEVVVQWE